MEVPRIFCEPSHHYPRLRFQSINGGNIRPSYSGGPPSPLDTNLFDTYPHSPRRSHSVSTPDSMYRDREPWRQTAHTYAWVLDQEIAEMSRQNEETVRWVHEQRKHEQFERDIVWRRMTRARGLQKVVSSFDPETRSKRQDADVLAARLWSRKMEEAMEDELRRLQASRREAERCRMVYEKRKAQEEARARQHREQQKSRALRDEVNKAAWSTYEERWADLTTGDSSELVFNSIPWPVFSSPRKARDITSDKITAFILSPLHSSAQSRKERIKTALRRWHPDRFGRVLSRVAEDDKAEVEEAAGVIVRCLNELLERES